ncbi:hypothetical protein HMPREF0044_1063 [Gleimia coleocanis DSM 15436]|uniref:Uncharacterized protein n=1 Tax=Gleimia coleocanis DSM 15436 TaxID=525245 RepID=C0W0I5_9ACTO|nr:hypothetical protein [Gleimia coleocanis]EEH64044.1 hypothetical protein HMPREF0044_1063 [Gleimia coleocanis DSM 15436]
MSIFQKLVSYCKAPSGQWPASRLSPVRSAKDQRGPAWGLGRVVIASFWISSLWYLWAEATSLVKMIAGQDASFSTSETVTSWSVALGKLLPVLLFFVIAVSLTHNGRRMRKVGGISLLLTVLGLLSTLIRDEKTASLVWLNLGSSFYYLPLILSCVGFVWLWWSNPRRIVELAEKF